MKINPTPRKLASAQDVATFYGIGLATVWRWLSQGQIPKPIKIGGRTFWEMEELHQHIAVLRAQRDGR